LDAEYGEMLWYATIEAADEVIRITPPPFSRIGFTECLAQRNGPSRLVFSTWCQSSTGKSSNARVSPPITLGTPPRETTPALAHIMSSLPNADNALATVAATSASTVVSPSTAMAFPPKSVTSLRVPSARSPWMSMMTTLAPSDANNCADCRPNPEPAPVMTATLPSSLGITGPLCCTTCVNASA
jgi:hypothetical protein